LANPDLPAAMTSAFSLLVAARPRRAARAARAPLGAPDRAARHGAARDRIAHPTPPHPLPREVA